MYEGDGYEIDDLDVFVWREKMKSQVFKDYFESVVEARVYDDAVGLKKVGDNYKWQKKKR